MNAKDKKQSYWRNKTWRQTGIYRETDLSFEETKNIQARYVRGESPAQIARIFGVTICSIRKALGIPDQR
jgi:hypothetical protein